MVLQSTQWLKRAWRFANEERGAIAVGTTIAGGLASATYAAMKMRNEVMQFRSDVESAQRCCEQGRKAYMQNNDAEATTLVVAAATSADEARKRVDAMLSPLRSVAFFAANMSEGKLLHLAAHAYFHVAVMKIRNKNFDEALRLLERSLQFRDAAGTGFGRVKATSGLGTTLPLRKGHTPASSTVARPARAFSR